MGVPKLLKVVERQGKTAIIFVHGFGGDAAATWGDFPSLIRDEARSLSDWSIYSLGYSSTLAPDLRGIWAADPGIEKLAGYLYSRTTQVPLKNYDRLAFVAHSMGGLVVQKALVDRKELVRRVGHVLLYGTPSGGLESASGFLGRLFKRQTQDMGLDSEFIPALRRGWQDLFGDGEKPLPQRPFHLWTVAGDRDDFVPASSSLGPFSIEDQVVVPGNHLEIVKPAEYGSMSVQAAVDALVGEAAPGGPWNAARVAVEMGHFQLAIETLLPNADGLDEPSVVQLALALEAVGRQDDAIEILERRGKKGTDALGVLAGRFKRQWSSGGVQEPAERALALYRQAYETSVQGGTADQAFYHGINVAFMTFAFLRDEAAAQKIAREVLGHCAKAKRQDVWCLATIGEAHLYLGDMSAAMDSYRAAVATDPQPWQMKSMYDQALRIVEALEDEDAQRAIREIFFGVEPGEESSRMGSALAPAR